VYCAITQGNKALVTREEYTMLKISANMNGRRRFNVFGFKGFVALRKQKSRGWGIESQNTFTQIHLGKTSVAFDMRPRHTYNFAG
jgi:hypothetical protein